MNAPLSILRPETLGERIAFAKADEREAAYEAHDSLRAAKGLDLKPLDFANLKQKTPPERLWAVRNWLGRGHVTGLFGRGGIGKSLLAQQIASALAIGHRFIDEVEKPLRVLCWFSEDDEAELWRRQVRIAEWLGVDLGCFYDALLYEPGHEDASDNLIMFSCDGIDCTMAHAVNGKLEFTFMRDELRMQISDYGADFVILDNIARLFAGNENDRHQTTQFVAELTGLAKENNAGILLLGHPGRANGSEFSGSSAWENAMRARLWLADRLPDAKIDEDEGDPGEQRFLCKRKANYTHRDFVELNFADGVLKPLELVQADGGVLSALRFRRAENVALEAFRKLVAMGHQPSDGASSPSYLPRMAIDYRLAEGLTKREIADGMRSLMTAGKLRRGPVGQYANRTPKLGLLEA